MVKNVSDQSIREIILHLDLPTDDPKVGDRRIDIHYGRGYLYTREPDTRVPDVLLKPGEIASFSYNTNNPKAYDFLIGHLKNDHLYSLPTRGTVFLGAVVFEDIDKGWYAPTYAVRCGTSWCGDPDKPYRMGQVRKGATMLKASFVSKQPQEQEGPKDLTISPDYMSVPPLTILNARRTDEGLTVEVQNNGLAPIEYFELHLSGSRVWAGRNSLDVTHRDHPKNLEQPVLSLAPQEVRTFQFPVKSNGDGIRIEIVFLSNGQGWFQGFWLRKLDKARENGMLWNVDHEESKRRMIR
jgi:hypothetical protein